MFVCIAPSLWLLLLVKEGRFVNLMLLPILQAVVALALCIAVVQVWIRIAARDRQVSLHFTPVIWLCVCPSHFICLWLAQHVPFFALSSRIGLPYLALSIVLAELASHFAAKFMSASILAELAENAETDSVIDRFRRLEAALPGPVFPVAEKRKVMIGRSEWEFDSLRVIMAVGNAVELRLVGGATAMATTTLTTVTGQFNLEDGVTISRSCWISCNCDVEPVHRKGELYLRFPDGHELKVARPRKQAVLDWLVGQGKVASPAA